MAEKASDGADHGHAERSPAALQAALVTAMLTGTAWVAPSIGSACTISLAVGLLVLAPIAFGWNAQEQALAAATSATGFLYVASTNAAFPERLTTVAGALTIGAGLSIIGPLLRGSRSDSNRLERKRLAQRMKEALAGLEIRAGLGSLTHGGPSIDDDDDPVAMVEQVAVGLGRAMVEQRKTILHEREMNAHFIGQAAHEFRTPLTVIQTAAEALKLYSGRMSSHQQHVRLVKIEESVQEMTGLLRNALTFSRADAGKIRCERQPVDLRALTQEVARNIQGIAEHEIVVTVRGAARLPQLDPSLAREILINLLTNAAKYSSPGDKIEVEVVTATTEVRIRVTDHGIGIGPEDQKHVFDPFRRGANVGDIPGTGLGLAITKRAVQNHGGTISFESQLGSGTTFTVTLPDRAETSDPMQVRRVG
jgi:signal transduction histidine kinase